MSTLILVTSHNLKPEQTQLFWDTLRATGYQGDVGLISNDLVVSHQNVIYHPWEEDSPYFRSSRRLFAYNDFLQKHNQRWDTIILTGIRDVLFQKNPETIPHGTLDIYSEWEEQKIGTCPYNSQWILNSYGSDVLDRLYRDQVICAEIVIGNYDGMRKFLREMISEAEQHTRKHDLEDQAMLNYLYHTGKLQANLMVNEKSAVYTVGALPYIRISRHRVLNSSLDEPWIIHQYDRHV